MKKFAAPLAAIAILAASLGFTAPAEAATSTPSTQIAIKAPAVTLHFEKVKVTTTKAPAPKRCEEDQPCWNCKTMGNRICGPVFKTPVIRWTPPAPQVKAPAPQHAAKAPKVTKPPVKKAKPQPPKEQYGTDAPFVFGPGTVPTTPPRKGMPTNCPVIHPSQGGSGAWAGSSIQCGTGK